MARTRVNRGQKPGPAVGIGDTDSGDSRVEILTKAEALPTVPAESGEMAAEIEEHLKAMARVQLQGLAKQHGIKANQSNLVMVNLLRDVFVAAGSAPFITKAGSDCVDDPASDNTKKTPKGRKSSASSRHSVASRKSIAKRSLETAPEEPTSQDEVPLRRASKISRRSSALAALEAQVQSADEIEAPAMEDNTASPAAHAPTPTAGRGCRRVSSSSSRGRHSSTEKAQVEVEEMTGGNEVAEEAEDIATAVPLPSSSKSSRRKSKRRSGSATTAERGASTGSVISSAPTDSPMHGGLDDATALAAIDDDDSAALDVVESDAEKPNPQSRRASARSARASVDADRTRESSSVGSEKPEPSAQSSRRSRSSPSAESTVPPPPSTSEASPATSQRRSSIRKGPVAVTAASAADKVMPTGKENSDKNRPAPKYKPKLGKLPPFQFNANSLFKAEPKINRPATAPVRPAARPAGAKAPGPRLPHVSAAAARPVPSVKPTIAKVSSVRPATAASVNRAPVNRRMTCATSTPGKDVQRAGPARRGSLAQRPGFARPLLKSARAGTSNAVGGGLKGVKAVQKKATAPVAMATTATGVADKKRKSSDGCGLPAGLRMIIT